jgi:hypothetical protein
MAELKLHGRPWEITERGREGEENEAHADCRGEGMPWGGALALASDWLLRAIASVLYVVLTCCTRKKETK